MPKRRGKQRGKAISVFFVRLVLVNFYFGFLGKLLNFKPLEDEEKESLNLTIFIVTITIITYVLGIAGGYMATFTSSVSANFLNIAVIVLVPYLISLELIKQRVSVAREAFSTVRKVDGREELSHEELEQAYYLSRIVCNDSESSPGPVRTFSGLELRNFHKSLYERANEASADEFQVTLESEFHRNVEQRKVKCILLGLSDENFFKPLSLRASMRALGIENQDRLDRGTSGNVFWQDIYLYLKAWLVCSLDSESGNPMPLSAIGLNYPHKERPAKSKYKKALYHIKASLASNDKALVQLNHHKPTIKAMQEGLDVLIALIDEYDQE